MAIGVLAGRYEDAESYPADSRAQLRGGYSAARVTARGVRVAAEFAGIAARAGLTSAQLAVLWCKDQPGITAPLIGPRTFEHLEILLPVMEMRLSEHVRAACVALVPPGSVVANFHNTSGWMKTDLPR